MLRSEKNTWKPRTVCTRLLSSWRGKKKGKMHSSETPGSNCRVSVCLSATEVCLSVSNPSGQILTARHSSSFLSCVFVSETGPQPNSVNTAVAALREHKHWSLIPIAHVFYFCSPSLQTASGVRSSNVFKDSDETHLFCAVSSCGCCLLLYWLVNICEHFLSSGIQTLLVLDLERQWGWWLVFLSG